jgi:short-subunit dehydrogenase
MYDNYFNQKVVIITGSSMGIGKSLALLLAKSKAKVVLNARSKDKLFATVNELKAAGCDVLGFAGDVTLETDCNALISATIEHFGKIDVLVNNAGVSMRGPVANLSAKVIADVFNINTIAPLVLTQIAMPHIKQSNGSIVFISSLAGLRGLPLISIYSAAKMSLTAIAQALRVEHYADNIHIGLIYVGITKIEKDKTALDANGEKVLLDERNGFFTSNSEHVAKKIASNIAKRKKQSVIGIAGKVYYSLIRFLPGLVEFLLIRSQKKMNKLYK